VYHANKESKQKNRGRTPWTILENSHGEHEHGAFGQPSTAHKEIPASNIKSIPGNSMATAAHCSILHDRARGIFFFICSITIVHCPFVSSIV